MRILMSFCLLAAGVIALGAGPALARSGAHGGHGAHGSPRIFRAAGGDTGTIVVSGAHGFGGAVRHARLSRGRGRGRGRGDDGFGAWPWGWDYGSYAVIAPPGDSDAALPIAARAPTPVAELPRCRESIGSVDIVRGRACRT